MNIDIIENQMEAIIDCLLSKYPMETKKSLFDYAKSYNENAHSKILLEILNNKYDGLKGVIIFLNDLGITGYDNQNTNVVFGKHEIDLLIIDHKNQRAVIIENKIKNAKDQKRQLYRYFNAVIQDGYAIDKILYLPEISRKAGYQDYTEDEVRQVEIYLQVVPYFASNNEMCIYKIIQDLACKHKNIENDSFLNEYKKYLEKMGRKRMENKLEQEYIEYYLKDNNREWIQKIIELTNEFNKAYGQRIVRLASERYHSNMISPWFDEEYNVAVLKTKYKEEEIRIVFDVINNREKIAFYVNFCSSQYEKEIAKLLISESLIIDNQYVEAGRTKHIKSKYIGNDNELFEDVEIVLKCIGIKI